MFEKIILNKYLKIKSELIREKKNRLLVFVFHYKLVYTNLHKGLQTYLKKNIIILGFKLTQ